MTWYMRWPVPRRRLHIPPVETLIQICNFFNIYSNPSSLLHADLLPSWAHISLHTHTCLILSVSFFFSLARSLSLYVGCVPLIMWMRVTARSECGLWHGSFGFGERGIHMVPNEDYYIIRTGPSLQLQWHFITAWFKTTKIYPHIYVVIISPFLLLYCKSTFFYPSFLVSLCPS